MLLAVPTRASLSREWVPAATTLLECLTPQGRLSDSESPPSDFVGRWALIGGGGRGGL